MPVKSFQQVDNLLSFNFLIKVWPKVLNDFLAMRIATFVIIVTTLYLQVFNELRVKCFIIFKIWPYKCTCSRSSNDSLNMHNWIGLFCKNGIEDVSWYNAHVLILWQTRFCRLNQHIKPLWHLIDTLVNILVSQDLEHDVVVFLKCVKLCLWKWILIITIAFFDQLLAHLHKQTIEAINSVLEVLMNLKLLQTGTLINLIEDNQDLVNYFQRWKHQLKIIMIVGNVGYLVQTFQKILKNHCQILFGFIVFQNLVLKLSHIQDSKWNQLNGLKLLEAVFLHFLVIQFVNFSLKLICQRFQYSSIVIRYEFQQVDYSCLEFLLHFDIIIVIMESNVFDKVNW